MKIKRAKVITDNNEQEGFLFIEPDKTLFVMPSDSKGISRWPALEGCYCYEDWQSYIEPLIKKGVLFDPWSRLKDVGVAVCDLTSPLIHIESGLLITADFGENDDNIHFMISDSSLDTLYDAANVYLEQNVTWDTKLLDVIFSTKVGKDCSPSCKESKDISSLLSYFRDCWLDSNPEAVELMEINLIKEKRIKHANERL